jgi:diadenylate cyclase
LINRLTQLYESMTSRDLVQIGILAVVIYVGLRVLGKLCGSGAFIGRGLGLVVVVLFLAAQVVIASLGLTELGRVLDYAVDYLLTAAMVGLVVIFQPELRRGLMVLGRRTLWRYLGTSSDPLVDRLADAAEGLSRECIGALIAIQRDVGLAPYIETGEMIDARISASLIRTVFSPRSPLHDGAVILCNGRLRAAGCQLPLCVHDRHEAERPGGHHLGMRHRAALSLSEETDAVVLVVSEETGRISLAVGGDLEPVPRENLSRRLADELTTPGRAALRAA